MSDARSSDAGASTLNSLNSNAGTSIPREQRTAYQRWELDSFDIQEPQNSAEAIVLPTAEQIEQMHQQAHEEGYAAGYREGTQKAAADMARLQQIVAALTQESQQCDQRLADELLALALQIGKQVMRQALQVRPDMILTVINEVISQAPQTQRRAQLILHPEDAALVRTRMGEHLTRSGWEIIEDGGIARGGCRLKSSECDIDATLENRWLRVTAVIGNENAWID